MKCKCSTEMDDVGTNSIGFVWWCSRCGMLHINPFQSDARYPGLAPEPTWRKPTIQNDQLDRVVGPIPCVECGKPTVLGKCTVCASRGFETKEEEKAYFSAAHKLLAALKKDHPHTPGQMFGRPLVEGAMTQWLNLQKVKEALEVKAIKQQVRRWKDDTAEDWPLHCVVCGKVITRPQVIDAIRKRGAVEDKDTNYFVVNCLACEARYGVKMEYGRLVSIEVNPAEDKSGARPQPIPIVNLCDLTGLSVGEWEITFAETRGRYATLRLRNVNTGKVGEIEETTNTWREQGLGPLVAKMAARLAEEDNTPKPK